MLQKLDKDIEQLVVIFNTSMATKTFAFAGAEQFNLHPVQQQSGDTIVKASVANKDSFSIPALTTAVFVRPLSSLE